MKKIHLALMCIASAAIMSACGGNANAKNNGAEAPKEQQKTEKKGTFDFGDKFAFAGLESAKLVPPSGKEIAERKVPTRNMSKPMKDCIYIYTGDTKEAVSLDELNGYFVQVYEAAKAAATDGKIYKSKGMGDTHLGEEITQPKVSKSTSNSFECIYKHDGTWFKLKAGHSWEMGGDVWVKDYPEKFYVWSVFVQEYFVDE